MLAYDHIRCTGHPRCDTEANSDGGPPHGPKFQTQDNAAALHLRARTAHGPNFQNNATALHLRTMKDLELGMR